MIPILYDAFETDFETNGIGLLTDTVSCQATEERNGAYEAILTYPAKGHLSEYIKEQSIIKIKANDTDEPQLFRIYKSGKQINNNTTYYAEHISYELTANPVEHFSVSGVNAADALNKLLGAAVLPHRYSADSDITTVNNTSIDDVVSVRKALGGIEGSILDTYGGEYHFNNYKIKLLKNRGKDNGLTIEYGKNLIDAKQEKNIANIVTAIFPYAKYQTEEKEEIYVSLKEKIIKADNSEKYAYTRCSVVDFSQDFESGTAITEEMLRTKAIAYLKKLSTEPDVNITLSYAQLKKTKDYKNMQIMEDIAICDTVTVRIDKLNINVKAKVVKTKYDSLKERYESMEIGSIRTNLVKELTNIQKETAELIKNNGNRAEEIRKQIEQTIKDVTAAITGNSGGHVVLHPAQNPQEIFVLDENNLNTAKNVWRWNLSGLGHSSTGINGPFTTAMTADGQIVADCITAGELTGAIIKAGTIRAEALDIEYRNSVIKYTDDAKAEAIETSITKIESTAEELRLLCETIKEDATGKITELQAQIELTDEAIQAEVKRASGIEEALRAAINVNADKITSCVTKGNVGSYITQYYNNVLIAFNNSSRYVQIKAGEIGIYNGAIDKDNLRSVFDERGNRFYRDGYIVGNVGTNRWSGDETHKGLVFDLEYQGKYMAWARKKEDGAGSYTTILCYSRANSIYDEEGLHLGTSLYGGYMSAYNMDLRESSANGYRVSNNKKIPVVTSIERNSDGTLTWHTSSIIVRNGMITGVPSASTDI